MRYRVSWGATTIYDVEVEADNEPEESDHISVEGGRYRYRHTELLGPSTAEESQRVPTAS